MLVSRSAKTEGKSAARYAVSRQQQLPSTLPPGKCTPVPEAACRGAGVPGHGPGITAPYSNCRSWNIPGAVAEGGSMITLILGTDIRPRRCNGIRSACWKAAAPVRLPRQSASIATDLDIFDVFGGRWGSGGRFKFASART